MSDSAPSQPKRRRSPEELIEAAKKAEQRAADRLGRKVRQRQKYEAVQRTRERKLDTRRKIVAGAIALETMKRNPSFAAAFRDLLNTYVTRDEDRVLFGLEADPASTTPICVTPPAPVPSSIAAAAAPAAPAVRYTQLPGMLAFTGIAKGRNGGL